MTVPLDVALDARTALGEGPIWDVYRAALLFVDIHRQRVFEFDPVQPRPRVLEVGRSVSAIVPTVDRQWVAAADLGFLRIDPETAAVTGLIDVEPAGSRRRMNDGAVDPAGRLWAGSMSLDGVEGQGSLYCLDAHGQVSRVVSPVTTSNGPAWSPDGRLMYYVDTRTRRIDVLDFDAAAGTVANRRVFVAFTDGPGRPDGVIVDAEGGIWVALWQGASVHRYLPNGRLDFVLPVPTPCPTKCAFGGPDLRDLFITSARAPVAAETDDADPRAGALYHCRPGVRGQPTTLFGAIQDPARPA